MKIHTSIGDDEDRYREMLEERKWQVAEDEERSDHAMRESQFVSAPLTGGSAPLQWLCPRCRHELDEDAFCASCGHTAKPGEMAA